MDLSDHLIEEFMRAAAFGAALEIRMRLLCGIVPEIAPQSTATRLELVEEALAAHFASVLTAKELELLQRARRLRNKLFHADFREARAKLRELDGGTSERVVRMVELTPGQELTQLSQVAAAPNVAGVFVDDSDSTHQGTVFGWLLELGASGDLARSGKVFGEGIRIVERLRTQVEG